MVFLHQLVSNHLHHVYLHFQTYFNRVIAAICAPVYLFYLPSLRQPGNEGRSVSNRLVSIDWLGILLSIGMVVTFTMAVTFAGVQWEWSSGRTIAMFVVFAILFIAIFVQQYFTIFTTLETRLFPSSRVLRTRSQFLLFSATAMSTANLTIPLYYIPLLFQFVHGDTSIMAAVRLLPFVLILVFTNLAIGALLPKIGY